MEDEFTVRKLEYVVPFSADVLMDAGVIPDTRPPVKWSRRQRARWWLSGRWWKVRRRVGFWIAGEEGEDW